MYEQKNNSKMVAIWLEFPKSHSTPAEEECLGESKKI